MLLLASLLSAGLAGQPSGPPEGRAVFAGGCFWGVEWVFEHVRGVRSATAGYGPGGVETVDIRYDPDQVSYRQLLEVFFLVAHDPTSRDRQGPDAGPEYRAIVFAVDPAQRRAVESYLGELAAGHRFDRPIVTELQPLGEFRVAEDFHQGFAEAHPRDPYIVANDVPKLARLKRRFPDLYRSVTRP
jgi:peptide-methionine (S)-S-oxide reductase